MWPGLPAHLKHDAYGYPLPDRTKGMIFLRQAKIPGHLEDHIMAKTNGSRNFSNLLDGIQILAQRPMTQVSSSFPSYDDNWDEGTNATEYYDIHDHNAVDNDGYCDEYDEPEDHDGEWIDMSGIPEDLTFEEPELASMLENLQKGRKGSSKGFRRGKKGWSKGESRDVLKLSTKEAGKGGRSESYKKVRLKLQSDRLNRARETSRLMERTKGVVAHSWLRWMISSPAPVVPNLESWAISRNTGMVCNVSYTVHHRNDFCADHSRDNSHAGVSRNESRALETNRVHTLILETGLSVGGDFQRDDETFLSV